jgi:hypothetical protein
MNYTDIILKLLSKRESISCSEDSLISDFSDNENPAAAFKQWCNAHKLVIIRNPDEKNIILEKESYSFSKKTE